MPFVLKITFVPGKVYLSPPLVRVRGTSTSCTQDATNVMVPLAGTRGGVNLFQPEPFFLFGHRAFLNRLGKALFLRTLLLAVRCVACLTAIEREGGLAMLQHH